VTARIPKRSDFVTQKPAPTTASHHSHLKRHQIPQNHPQEQ